MSALTTPAQINAFRLATLRQGILAEMHGMRLTRGRSATAIVKEMLGLPRNTPRIEILRLVSLALAEARAEVDAEA